MSTNYAVRVNAPKGNNVGGAAAIATAATTVGTISFGSVRKIWIKADVDTLINFGGSTTATCTAPTTAASQWLTANVDYIFDIAPDVTNARAKKKASASTGTLRWKPVA